MSSIEDAAREALAYWIYDVTMQQDVVEVLVKMLNGWGITTYGNVTIHPNWTWQEFEKEHQFLRPGCLLLTAGRPFAPSQSDAELYYPVPYGVLCDEFQEFLDKQYLHHRSGEQLILDVANSLLARYRHDLETLSDDEWREIVKNYDPQNPMTSGRTAASFGVPVLEPWPRERVSSFEQAVRDALNYWFLDVISSQDVVEVLVEMLNGYGRGTHENVTIAPNWTFYEFEEEFALLKPGCFLLCAG